MMPGNLFRLELAEALGDRRRLVLRTGISVLLAMPFIFVEMPPRAKAAGLTMVILFTGFFGAAVHHARLRADSRLARLYLLPIRRSVLWLDLALASMLARFAPAVVVLACFVLVGRGGSPSVGTGPVCASTIWDLAGLAGLLCGALLLLTLLGMAVGRLAHSNGEVHLFGALAAALLAFVSGIAPLPDRLGWLAATAAWNPISRLLAALTAIGTDPSASPSPGGGHGGPGLRAVPLLVLVGVTVLATQRWLSGRSVGCRSEEDRAANPQSEIMSPRAQSRGRNPQSQNPQSPLEASVE